MKLLDVDEAENILWIVYLFKTFYDEGKEAFIKNNSKYILCMDVYYECILESLDYAADIAVCDETIYRRHGYTEPDHYEDLFIYSFSSKEMQEYFKLARKLHKLQGSRGKNPYYERLYNMAEQERNFYSYDFDYLFMKKQTAACLDVLWGCEFSYEILMVIWVMKVMRLFREELPKLKEEYRRARREKRRRKKLEV